MKRHFLSKLRRALPAAMLLLATAGTAGAHRIEYYTSSGCVVIGDTLKIDALVVFAPGNTYYNWQYKTATGSWTCFSNGNNTINSTTFANVTGASGSGADNAPELKIPAPTAALENVQIRCIMRENLSPCANSTNPIWGGDDQAKEEVKTLRLRVSTSASPCNASCANNTLTNSNGFYGGFEAVDYTNGTFTNENFLSGTGATDIAGNATTGYYSVVNNPYAYNTAFTAFAPHSGNYQMVVKGGTGTTTRAWFKTITVQPGATYDFSAWTSRVDGNPPTLQLKAGSTNVGSSLTPSAIGNWQQLSGSYTVPAGVTSVTFSITDVASGASNNYVLDDICLVLASNPITIGGKLWFDTNKDGEQDNNEIKIQNGTVQLFADNDANGTADGGALQTDVTDANGAYSFTNLPVGKYFVKFTLPTNYVGFTIKTAAGIPANLNSDADATSGQTATSNFTTDNQTIDAGVIKNIGISGNVYNDANGMTDNLVNGTALSTVSSAPLYVNLYTSANVFVSSVAVTGGAYSFSNLAGNTSYKAVVSTVMGVAGSTPSSVLPELWISTGEIIGTGTGSDNIADGINLVSLTDVSVTDVKFALEAIPAPIAKVLPVATNPGGTVNVTIPDSSFRGTDPDGSVSSVRISGFPYNVTSIRIKDTTYYANSAAIPTTCPSARCRVFPAVGVVVPSVSGKITLPVSIDPVNGAITAEIPFTVTDNAGKQSVFAETVDVPLVVPDLAPNITVTPSIFIGTASASLNLRTLELNNASTDGTLITMALRTSANYSLNNLAVGTVINGWTYQGVVGLFYRFTCNKILKNSSDEINVPITFNPNGNTGQYVFSLGISSGSGGEINFANNSDQETVTFRP